MSASVAVGALIAGKYRLEREIGAGGMGIVFAATHVHLEQRVALKFLLTENATAETLARFWREARAAVKVQSEHVARVIDVGELDGQTPYIVMEYLEGDDLENIVKACGPLPVSDAIRYLLQACEALAEVHALGIVHRDIKPANLFITSRADGSSIVKLLDFGISKAAPEWEAKGKGLTHTSAVIGSPRYMSPEQLRSSRDVDARTDVWALGVTLFELLGGNSPFASGTMPEVCASILKDAPLSLAELRPEIPVALENVIRCCLEKKPAARWSDVAALANALRPFGPAASSTMSAERIANVLLQGRPPTVPPSTAPAAPRDEAARTTSNKSKLGMGATEHAARPSQQIAVVKAAELPVVPRAATAFHDPRSDAQLEAHYLAQIGDLRAIPHRMMDLAKMTSLSLDHRAGFLMSRMDGHSTLEELLDVSGMARLETLKLVCNLLEHRLIRLAALS